MRIFLNILIPVFTVYAVCVWGPRLLVFFMPFVIGRIVAMIANPLVRFLERKIKIVRKHSSMVLLVAVLALVVCGLYFLVGWGIREMKDFVEALPGLYKIIQEDVTQAYRSLSRVFNFVPEDMENSFGQVMNSVGAFIGEFLQNLAASAGGAVARTLPEVLVNVIVTLVSSYLFLAEHDVLVEKVRRLMPESVKRYGVFLKKDTKALIGSYFLAQFKIMFVVAVVLFAGLLLHHCHWDCRSGFSPHVWNGNSPDSMGYCEGGYGGVCLWSGIDFTLYSDPGHTADYSAQDCGRQHGSSASYHTFFPLSGI